MKRTEKTKARRLKTLAVYINANWPEYEAKISQSVVTPSSHCLQVRRRSNGQVVYWHDGGATYRTNTEVEMWVAGVEAGRVQVRDMAEHLMVRW